MKSCTKGPPPNISLQPTPPAAARLSSVPLSRPLRARLNGAAGCARWQAWLAALASRRLKPTVGRKILKRKEVISNEAD
jgi:hypothetical protein